MALIHAFLVITLRANQIVSGLALTIFAGAAGLSSYLGNDLNLADQPAKHSFTAFLPHSLADRAGRRADPLRPARRSSTPRGLLRRRSSRSTSTARGSGLNLRAVGESPAAADAMGINVTALPLRAHARRRRVRRRRRRDVHARDHAAVGRRASRAARAGSRSRSSSSRSGGRRSASSARTSSARSRASRSRSRRAAILSGVPPELFQSLPYVMTIVVLVLVSSAGARRRLGAPAALGTPYVREER